LWLNQLRRGGKARVKITTCVGGTSYVRKKLMLSATMLLAASLPWQANASTFDFNFAGGGVSGSIELTYGTATDAKYPQAFEVTGISGTFSDSNNGLNIVNAAVGPLVAIKRDAPEPTNLLAPNDFSRFPVANGLPAQSHGAISYDNLYYPAGSPPTATDYQVHGGFLDIYGLLFDIGGGQVANIWSNGDFTGTGNGHVDYGASVATSTQGLDYVSGGVSITPEPSAFVLLGAGLAALAGLRRRSAARR
jgi:hypothetical protein